MEEEIMTMTATTFGPAGSGLVELDVIPIEEDGWRVSIHGADRGNPFALLGFVTRVGDRFEVCVIGHPGDGIETATLDEAIEVLRPAPDEVQDILSGIRH